MPVRFDRCPHSRQTAPASGTAALERRRRPSPLRAAGCVFALCLALAQGCLCEPAPTGTSAAPSSTAAAPSAARGAQKPVLHVPVEPTTLLEWKESAYGTTLYVRPSEVLLLTQTAALRLAGGRAPQRMSVSFGPGPALVGDTILYWHDGAVRGVDRHGSEPRRLGALERAPQRFLAAGDRFAWLDRDSNGTSSLRAFHGEKLRILYQTNRLIAAATTLEDWVFFVERAAGPSWKLGRVGLDGKPPAFSKEHPGRTPSMLASAEDGIYLYDGPNRSVLRLSPDLQEQRVVARTVICSPLAVSDRLVCAQVGGVFDVPVEGGPPRPLAPEPAGPIATIAADTERVVWVADAGERQLVVRSVPLPPLDEGVAGAR